MNGKNPGPLSNRVERMSRRQFLDALATMVSIAAAILAGALCLYFVKFGPAPLSDDPAVWGQFGDFVGGFVNPVFGFLSLLALILTIVLQSRHLDLALHEAELSRNELEASMDQMKRSAETQEAIARSQRAQAEMMALSARINALAHLLTQQDYVIEHARRSATLSDARDLTEAKAHKFELLRELADVYAELRRTRGADAQQAVEGDGPASSGPAP